MWAWAWAWWLGVTEWGCGARQLVGSGASLGRQLRKGKCGLACTRNTRLTHAACGPGCQSASSTNDVLRCAAAVALLQWQGSRWLAFASGARAGRFPVWEFGHARRRACRHLVRAAGAHVQPQQHVRGAELRHAHLARRRQRGHAQRAGGSLLCGECARCWLREATAKGQGRVAMRAGAARRRARAGGGGWMAR